MSEKESYTQEVDRLTALSYGEAANQSQYFGKHIGEVSVHALANEGESYTTERGDTTTVRKGHVLVEVSPDSPAAKDRFYHETLHNRDAIRRQTLTPKQLKAYESDQRLKRAADAHRQANHDRRGNGWLTAAR